MRKLLIRFIIIVLAITLGACATGPTTNQIGDITKLTSNNILHDTIAQVEALSSATVEMERKIADAFLEGSLFKIGFIGVMLKKSKMKVDTEVTDSLEQLKFFSLRHQAGDKLTDIEKGEIAAHVVYIYLRGFEYGFREIVPFVSSLLAL